MPMGSHGRIDQLKQLLRTTTDYTLGSLMATFVLA